MQKTRRGFTLIEVIVALGIFVIVLLILLSSFSFYYKYVREQRFQAIGENLAQLLLEDARNEGMPALLNLLEVEYMRIPKTYKCPNYPPAELYFYEDDSDATEWWSFDRADRTLPIGLGVLDDGSDNLPEWVDEDGNNIPPDDWTAYLDSYNVNELKEAIASITYKQNSVGEYVPWMYDSGIRDSDFVVEKLTNIPDELKNNPEKHLPDSIKLKYDDEESMWTLILEKWTFPLYKKQIIIENLTLDETEMTKKKYEVTVIVYWNNMANSVTMKQVIGFEGYGF